MKRYHTEYKEQDRERSRRYREQNKEKTKAAHREWLSRNKESQYQKHKADRRAGKHNCIHDIRKDTCSKCSPNSYLKKIISKRIWEALKQNKSDRSLEYLGCDIPSFRKHLEKSFKAGMTWENQGKGGWDIDHKSIIS